MRILVVDDDKLSGEVARTILRFQGHEVTLCEHGGEAITLCHLEGHIFDIVLMDLSMPVMDGYEATRRLRRDSRTRDLPIVILSAWVSELGQQLDDEIDGSLGKPYKRAELLAEMERAIALRQQKAAAPRRRAAPTAPL